MSNEIKGNISLCSSMEFEACTRVEFLYFRPPLPPTTELCRKTLWMLTGFASWKGFLFLRYNRYIIDKLLQI